jgi:hypothetical protein
VILLEDLSVEEDVEYWFGCGGDGCCDVFGGSDG